jgi:hypothetical protein
MISGWMAGQIRIDGYTNNKWKEKQKMVRWIESRDNSNL